MAYIKESGTYAQKFNSGKISENNVDMEKIAYVNDNLYDRICDKIGRLHKENGEPMISQNLRKKSVIGFRRKIYCKMH